MIFVYLIYCIEWRWTMTTSEGVIFVIL